MSTIVLKFGGSSLADIDKIKDVAKIVLEKKKSFKNIVVVVSAKRGVTENLMKDASFFENVSPREMDMLLTAGERVSGALMSMALENFGAKAVSLTGSQAGIITDDNHTNARIIEIRPHRVLSFLKEGKIVVVGGFQGVSFKKEVTTLGRGGSDISAVALASALKAEKCEIYSDVDGVFSSDPFVVKNVKKIEELSFQEMQEFSESGAKVLHPKAVEFAKNNNLEIVCKSTFSPQKSGTIIKNLEGRIKPKVVGIASQKEIVMVLVSNFKDVSNLFNFFDKNSLKVKQIGFMQNLNKNMFGSFIISKSDNFNFKTAIKKLSLSFEKEISLLENFSTISLVGSGITDSQEFILKTIEILSQNNIEISAIHTSSFRISVVIKRDLLENALNLLHKYFLEQK